jgi:transcription elongation factor Elf1
MTAPRDHACPRCGQALASDAVLVDTGTVRRECLSCRHVAAVEVTANE